MPGEYELLYQYLENRYANTVVLTFAQIEDLLPRALPRSNRLRRPRDGKRHRGRDVGTTALRGQKERKLRHGDRRSAPRP